MDLLLIRHAQSANNLLWERTGGSRGRFAEPPITDLGRRQATALADAFARDHFAVRPTRVIGSLMLRAVQSAAPLVDALDLPLHTRDDTHEFMGPVEMDPDDPQRRWPTRGASRSQLVAACPRVRLPNIVTEDGWWDGPVEDAPRCEARARALLADLVATYASEPGAVALVTHGTFTHYVMATVLGFDPAAAWISMHNTALCYLRDIDTHPQVAYVNRFDHLPADLVSI